MRTHSDSLIEELARSVVEDEYDDALQDERAYGGRVSAEDELVFLFRKYGARGRVLDVGAGSGYLFRALPITHAVEPNSRRLAKAIERGKERGVEVVQGFIEALPYPDEFFDTVIAWGVMCFVRSDSEALAEVNRVLKTGGSFIFDVVAETTLPIARPVNPVGYARWCECFGFRRLLVMPLDSPSYHRRYAVVLEKVSKFDWRMLRAPQLGKDKILNYCEERDWWLL